MPDNKEDIKRMRESQMGGPGRFFAVLLVMAGFVIFGVTMRQEIIAKRLQSVQAKVILPEGKIANATNFISNSKMGASKANTWNVLIKYEYVVNGKNYNGYLASLSGNSFTSEIDALKSIEGLMGDGTILAWYDKQHPNVAFLDPTPRRSGYKGAIICLMLAAFAYLYLDKIYYWLSRIDTNMKMSAKQ
jgi:hypothetical protein